MEDFLDKIKKDNRLSEDKEKIVVDVYFSKPEIDDLENVPIGQPQQKKRFPEIHKANLGDEIFLVARTENLIGKKLKIEIRQAKEKQIVDKDKPIVFKKQDKSGSITITVGKGAKDKDEIGQDYFSKYANANKLENLAWKSLLLRPESDIEYEQWKKILENSKEKKLYLYFHAEVVEEQDTDAKFLNTDKSEGIQNFSNSEGTYFEIGNASKCFCLEQGIVTVDCRGIGTSVKISHFEKLAVEMGVEKEVFQAVSIVESGGRGSFIDIDGKKLPKILYERHYMYRFCKTKFSKDQLSKLKKNNPELVNEIPTYKDKNASYGSEKIQYEKLKKAKKIDEDSAIKSCSWGKFQVMGKYYDYLYSSSKDMELAMTTCELQHYAYFKVFLEDVTGLSMIKAMKAKNWAKIAELYNGEDYEKTGYHIKMEKEYKNLKGLK